MDLSRPWGYSLSRPATSSPLATEWKDHHGHDHTGRTALQQVMVAEKTEREAAAELARQARQEADDSAQRQLSRKVHRQFGSFLLAADLHQKNRASTTAAVEGREVDPAAVPEVAQLILDPEVSPPVPRRRIATATAAASAPTASAAAATASLTSGVAVPAVPPPAVVGVGGGSPTPTLRLRPARTRGPATAGTAAPSVASPPTAIASPDTSEASSPTTTAAAAAALAAPGNPPIQWVTLSGAPVPTSSSSSLHASPTSSAGVFTFGAAAAATSAAGPTASFADGRMQHAAYVRPLAAAHVQRARLDLLPPQIAPHPLSKEAMDPYALQPMSPSSSSGSSRQRGAHASAGPSSQLLRHPRGHLNHGAAGGSSLDIGQDDDPASGGGGGGSSRFVLERLKDGDAALSRLGAAHMFDLAEAGAAHLRDHPPPPPTTTMMATMATRKLAKNTATKTQQLQRELFAMVSPLQQSSMSLSSAAVKQMRKIARALKSSQSTSVHAFPHSLRALAAQRPVTSFEATAQPLLDLLAPHVQQAIEAARTEQKEREEERQSKVWRTAVGFDKTRTLVGERLLLEKELRADEWVRAQQQATAMAEQALQATAANIASVPPTPTSVVVPTVPIVAAILSHQLQLASVDDHATSYSLAMFRAPPTAAAASSSSSSAAAAASRWESKSLAIGSGDAHRIPYQSATTSRDRPDKRVERPDAAMRQVGDDMVEKVEHPTPKRPRERQEEEATTTTMTTARRRRCGSRESPAPSSSASAPASPPVTVVRTQLKRAVHTAFLVDDVPPTALHRAGLITEAAATIPPTPTPTEEVRRIARQVRQQQQQQPQPDQPRLPFPTRTGSKQGLRTRVLSPVSTTHPNARADSAERPHADGPSTAATSAISASGASASAARTRSNSPDKSNPLSRTVSPYRGEGPTAVAVASSSSSSAAASQVVDHFPMPPPTASSAPGSEVGSPPPSHRVHSRPQAQSAQPPATASPMRPRPRAPPAASAGFLTGLLRELLPEVHAWKQERKREESQKRRDERREERRATRVEERVEAQQKKDQAAAEQAHRAEASTIFGDVSPSAASADGSLRDDDDNDIDDAIRASEVDAQADAERDPGEFAGERVRRASDSALDHPTQQHAPVRMATQQQSPRESSLEPALTIEISHAPDRPRSVNNDGAAAAVSVAGAAAIPPGELADLLQPRQEHAPVELLQCDTCTNLAAVRCDECESPFCRACSADLHSKRRFAHHALRTLHAALAIEITAVPDRPRTPPPTTGEIVSPRRSSRPLHLQGHGDSEEDVAPSLLIPCDTCSNPAVLKCADCEASPFCRDCFDDMHRRSARMRDHTTHPLTSRLAIEVSTVPARIATPPPVLLEVLPPRILPGVHDSTPMPAVTVCDICTNAAVLQCRECEAPYCRECFIDVHRFVRLAHTTKELSVQLAVQIEVVDDRRVRTPPPVLEAMAPRVLASATAEADGGGDDNDGGGCPPVGLLRCDCCSNPAGVACLDCESSPFCFDCFQDLHFQGARTKRAMRGHRTKPIAPALTLEVTTVASRPASAVKPPMEAMSPRTTTRHHRASSSSRSGGVAPIACDTCANAAVLRCQECESPYCSDCFADLHSKAARRNHIVLSLATAPSTGAAAGAVGDGDGASSYTLKSKVADSSHGTLHSESKAAVEQKTNDPPPSPAVDLHPYGGPLFIHPSPVPPSTSSASLSTAAHRRPIFLALTTPSTRQQTSSSSSSSRVAEGVSEIHRRRAATGEIRSALLRLDITGASKAGAKVLDWSQAKELARRRKEASDAREEREADTTRSQKGRTGGPHAHAKYASEAKEGDEVAEAKAVFLQALGGGQLDLASVQPLASSSASKRAHGSSSARLHSATASASNLLASASGSAARATLSQSPSAASVFAPVAPPQRSHTHSLVTPETKSKLVALLMQSNPDAASTDHGVVHTGSQSARSSSHASVAPITVASANVSFARTFAPMTVGAVGTLEQQNHHHQLHQPAAIPLSGYTPRSAPAAPVRRGGVGFPPIASAGPVPPPLPRFAFAVAPSVVDGSVDSAHALAFLQAVWSARPRTHLVLRRQAGEVESIRASMQAEQGEATPYQLRQKRLSKLTRQLAHDAMTAMQRTQAALDWMGSLPAATALRLPPTQCQQLQEDVEWYQAIARLQ